MTALANSQAQHTHRDRQPRWPFVSHRDDRTAAGRLCDDHGIALYLLACALTGSGEDARFLVAEAITDFSARPARTDRRTTDEVRTELARLVYRGNSRGGGGYAQPQTLRPRAAAADRVPLPEAMSWLRAVSARQREAIALCLYGGLTYRDAADVLALPASQVADLLSSGLRELATGHPSTMARHARRG